MPFFSIGVATYDRLDMLQETISSILAQTFSDFEVIVSNDNPNRVIDGRTLGIEDARLRFINQSKNLNAVNNMNYILGVSNSDYFTWLADDDLFQPNFLHSIHSVLLKFDFPPCIFTTYRMGNTFILQDNLCAGGRLLTGRHFLRHYLSGKIKVQGCYGVFKSQHIKDIMGLPLLGTSQFSFYADNLLAIRCGTLERVGFIDAPLIFYRAHKDSISLSNPDVDVYSSAQRDLLTHSIKIFRDIKLQDDFKKNLFDLLRWCIRDYFIVMGRSGRLQWGKLAKHLLFLFTYVKSLRNYQKIRLAVLTLIRLYRLVYYHFLDTTKKRLFIKRHPFNHILTTRFKARLIDKLLNSEKEGRLLDIGCGSGFILSRVDNRFGQAVGIDMCKESLGLSRGFTKAKMIVADAERLPFKDSMFDDIVSTDTFEHIRDDTEAVREIRRVLRPEGSLIVYVPSGEGILSGTRLVHLFHESQTSYLLDRRYYTMDSLKKLVQDAGFRIDAVRYHSVFFQEFFTQALKWLASVGGKRYEHQADINIFINSPLFPLYRWLFLPLINLMVRTEEIICENVFGGRIPGHRIIMKCRKVT